ncbi:MAG: hypothetical protein AAGJ28_07535 [Pseudomonadota bacterium]
MDNSAIYPTVSAIVRARPKLPVGPVAIMLCESGRHIKATARRLADQGMGTILYLGRDAPLGIDGPMEIAIAERPRSDRYRDLLNALFDMLDGRWVLWLWNGEFLVYPYCETRSLPEMISFLKDERRKVLFSYALDLYAQDLPVDGADPAAADLCFDRIGYHAFPKPDQQLRFYGGMGWRFEELTPPEQQQCGRSSLILAQKGVHLNREMLFGEVEYDSISCPWHHNPTGAVMSLRRSARIMAHPNFPDVAHSLIWAGTTKWDWTSRQLLELGMIEPGQWF